VVLFTKAGVRYHNNIDEVFAIVFVVLNRKKPSSLRYFYFLFRRYFRCPRDVLVDSVIILRRKVVQGTRQKKTKKTKLLFGQKDENI